MTVPENEELRVAHYMIKSQNGQFFISDKSRFDDIFALVDNYTRKSIILIRFSLKIRHFKKIITRKINTVVAFRSTKNY
jgi:hypothetical protein